MAAAGTLIAMLAQVAGHRYGFEFWGIRTASLVDSQARLLHWSVTGRPAPGRRQGGRVGGAAAPHRPGGGRGRGLGPTAQVKAASAKAASEAGRTQGPAARPSQGCDGPVSAGPPD